MPKANRADVREWISSGFIRVEDVVYVGLGLILTGGALFLLFNVVLHFVEVLRASEPRDQIVGLLDQILLIMMIIEILSTVQVSFREHTLKPEPFLIVGLIAAIRRILILTAEFSSPEEFVQEAFRNAMVELGLLTLLILAFGVSLFLLKRQPRTAIDRE
ncbi:MAG TPA: phosphate-starvation-inducible PsiE family protein [Candidatus Eisenbacteria bacterium]|nr:phosphate-starvation-inducible PsiE family protein [Candidatus Eisenbacteria bacterium]